MRKRTAIETCEICSSFMYNDGTCSQSCEDLKEARAETERLRESDENWKDMREERDTLRARLENAIEPDDLSERDYELIDGMIDAQRRHAERSLQMNNTVMGKKQHGWDMERVALLERIARLRGEE